LAIPITLIWSIKIGWRQKIALGCSLCLSILLIAITITRASGLMDNGTIDVVWEIYWQYVSAEIGLILSTATAFRAFFVARANDRQGAHKHPSWHRWLLSKISSAFTSIRATSRSRRQHDQSSEWNTYGARPWARFESEGKPSVEMQGMPAIPRATLTGMRTHIRRNGRQGPLTQSSRIMMSRTVEVEYEDATPLQGRRQGVVRPDDNWV